MDPEDNSKFDISADKIDDNKDGDDIIKVNLVSSI